MTRTTNTWLLILILLGLALRLPGLFANTFHADEALFASWARLITIWQDPLLQGQLLDKPPLLFYLQALFYRLVGPVVWAARLPNFIASLCLIPLSAQLAWRLYQEEMTAVLVAALVTFSPLAIQYSPTAFTDPLMVAFLVAALVAVSGSGLSIRPPSRRPFWAGLFAGLALLTKHQALLFFPLLIGLAFLLNWPRPAWRAWLAGLLPPLLVLILWEVGRTGRFALWATQLSAYGGLRVVHSWELWPRFGEWGEQWGYLIGSPILAFDILLAMPLFLALLIHDQDRPAALDQLLVIFTGAYFLLHWLLAIPIWDRYLLPVVPLSALILGRFVSRLLAFIRPELPGPLSAWVSPVRLTAVLPLVLLLVQLPAILQARNGQFPIGGQPTADHGAGQIAESLFPMPYGTVLYDHWYSWHMRYHLLDKKVY
jgi:4-amino-4-deoxy-L-arabinose transferase-like glycosyltransferase